MSSKSCLCFKSQNNFRNQKQPRQHFDWILVQLFAHTLITLLNAFNQTSMVKSFNKFRKVVIYTHMYVKPLPEFVWMFLISVKLHVGFTGQLIYCSFQTCSTLEDKSLLIQLFPEGLVFKKQQGDIVRTRNSIKMNTHCICSISAWFQNWCVCLYVYDIRGNDSCDWLDLCQTLSYKPTVICLQAAQYKEVRGSGGF